MTGANIAALVNAAAMAAIRARQTKSGSKIRISVETLAALNKVKKKLGNRR